MDTIDVIGLVPYFSGNEFHLVAENSAEVLDFVNRHQCQTRIDKNSEGKLKIKIRGSLANKCNPGEKIAHTITVQNNRFRGIDVKPFNRANLRSKSPVSDIEKTKNDLPKGNINPVKSEGSCTQYNRDENVKEWVLYNAKGVCELCDEKAPFVTSHGEPFLEIHHIRQIADGGSDTVSNTVASCPNCHREIHYGENRVQLINSLYKKIDRLVRE